MREVKIIGIGSYVPEQIMTNDDLSKLVDTSDEWITTRTGIKERRISKGENTSDLGAAAALNALKDANVKVEDIDLIVLSTSSPEMYSPSTACFVQQKIGAVNAICFDISAACAGFIYAMNVASQFIKTGQVKNALVIGAEVLSKVTDWKDRSTCVLFGDGAGAVVLTGSEEKGIISIFNGSDANVEILGVRGVPLRNPYVNPEKVEDAVIYMKGNEVFKFATSAVKSGIEKALENTGYSLKDVKYVVPHQANYRILEYAAKKLNMDIEKFYLNMERYGNTSSASIPIALVEMIEKGMVKKGDKLVFVAFGAGMTWSSALIEWQY